MIRALTLLFALQLAGEALATALALPVPGPVLGMMGLLAIFALRGGPTEAQEATAQGFLENLGLLFVPAGVGVTLHLGAVADEWPAILAAVVLGTLVAMVATALAFRWLARLTGSEDER
ncbi:MAG: CidA/LrgA family protein [Alphaproteobacteria bacterium]|nr:CidA/LrgA family protein [Alphaproteobacteria bacterium]